MNQILNTKPIKKKEDEQELQKSFSETASFGMGKATSMQDAWEKWALFKQHLSRHTSAMYKQQEIELFRFANISCALTHNHHD